MYKYILYILHIIYYILYIIYHIYIYNINMYQPVTKWDDPGIDPLMKFGIQWEGSICVALRIFHHKRWWSKVVWSEPCWEKSSMSTDQLAKSCIWISSTESELTIRTFWYLGLCEMFVQKMSMKSEGQRKKCWISGTFPQYLNGENYRQPWDLNDKTRRLNCFFLPESSRDWCYATVFFDPMRSHSQRLDWPDIII